MTPYDNNQGGNHSVTIVYNNGIATTTSLSFNVEVIQDWPLVAIVELPNIHAIANNMF